MKEMVRYGVTLSLICLIAAGLLAGVNSLTRSKILVQAQETESASLQEVIPQAVKFVPVKKNNEILYYKAIDQDGKYIGVVFKAYADGYASDIETVVGMLKDDTITAIKVLSQNETPGLGTQVTEESFLKQFNHKSIIGLDEVQAITGATISSTAVIDSVKEKAIKIKELIKNEE